MDSHTLILRRAGYRDASTSVVLVGYCVWAFEKAAASASSVPWFQFSIVPFAVAVFRYALLIDTWREVDASEFARLAGPVIFQCLIARLEPTDSFIQALVADWLQAPSAQRHRNTNHHRSG